MKGLKSTVLGLLAIAVVGLAVWSVWLEKSRQDRVNAKLDELSRWQGELEHRIWLIEEGTDTKEQCNDL